MGQATDAGGMNIFPFSPSTEVTAEARNALRATVIYLVATILASLGELYLLWQVRAWEMMVVSGVGITLAGVAFLCVRLTQYGHYQLGVRLLFAASLLTVLIAPLFILGFGLVLGLGMVLVVLTVASQTLASREVNLWLMTSVIIAMLAGAIDLFVDYLVLDLLNLNRRLDLPGFQLFIVILGGIMIATYAFFVARQFRSFALPTKLNLAFLFVSLVPLGLLALLNNYSTRIALIDDANHALFAAASQTADNVDAFVSLNLNNISTEAQLPSLLKYLNLPPDQRKGSAEEMEMASILTALAKRDGPFVASYAILDSQGHNIFDTDIAGVGQAESERDYYLEARQTGLPYMSPVLSLAGNDQLYLYFSSPVRQGSKGDVIGVLRVRYEAAVLQALIERNNGMGGDRSFAMLLDENHIWLAHGIKPDQNFKVIVPPEAGQLVQWQREGRLPAGPAVDLFTNLPDFEAGLGQAADQLHFTTRLDANKSLNSAAVAHLRTRPWIVVFVQPQEVFLAPIQAQARTVLFFAITIATIVVVVAFSIAQILAAPLLHLTGVVTQFTTGNLEARAEVQSDDEAGVLTHSFNEMAEQVGRLLGSLESYNDELELEINERKRAEAALQQSQSQLEEQVAARTTQLTVANEQLRQEISERRRTQAELEQAKELAEAANQAKSVFLANITHELRTPLNAILGYSEMLQDEVTDLGYSGLISDLKKIWSAGDHLLTIINDLLDLSKIEAGKMDLHLEHFDVPSMIEDVVMTAEPLVRKKDNTLQVICPELVGTMVTDPMKLRQILLNLLSNAAKFTEQGVITISVACQVPGEALYPEGQITFSVQDTGIGMSAGQIENIFKPFIQADTSTTRRYGGTGLGLAISARYCRMLGGEITVESELGQGSTFTIRLPIEIEMVETPILL